MVEASATLKALFLGLGIILGVLFVTAVAAAWQRTGAPAAAGRRATLYALAGTILWLGSTYSAAELGWLSFDGVPPTMLLAIAAMMGLALGLGFSGVGSRLAAGLPLWLLVGAQSFRLPLELMMHRAADEGVMPVQMSFSGYNFDILTGILALVVAAGLVTGRLGTRAAAAWNGAGVVLLLGIIVISFLSTPLPIRVFMNEPANIWIAQAPFVWLPTVMVFTAVLGHIVVFRRLRLERAGTRAQALDREPAVRHR